MFYVKPKWIAIAFSVMRSVFHTSMSWNMFISPTVSRNDYKYVVYTNCYKFMRYIFVQDCPLVRMSGTEIPLYIYDYMLQCILITCYYFIYVDIEFHAECNIWFFLLHYYIHITCQTNNIHFFKKENVESWLIHLKLLIFCYILPWTPWNNCPYPLKQNVIVFIVVTLLLH